VSGCDEWQADTEMMAQWSDFFQAHVTGALNQAYLAQIADLKACITLWPMLYFKAEGVCHVMPRSSAHTTPQLPRTWRPRQCIRYRVVEASSAPGVATIRPGENSCFGFMTATSGVT